MKHGLLRLLWAVFAATSVARHNAPQLEEEATPRFLCTSDAITPTNWMLQATIPPHEQRQNALFGSRRQCHNAPIGPRNWGLPDFIAFPHSGSVRGEHLSKRSCGVQEAEGEASP